MTTIFTVKIQIKQKNRCKIVWYSTLNSKTKSQSRQWESEKRRRGWRSISLDFSYRERKCDLGMVLWHGTKAREERAALGILISNRNRRAAAQGGAPVYVSSRVHLVYSNRETGNNASYTNVTRPRDNQRHTWPRPDGIRRRISRLYHL